MRERLGVASLVVAGIVLAPGRARAQYYFHADPTIRVTGGYNLTEVLSDQPNADPKIQYGPLATIAPALAMNLETPATTHKLSLTGTLSLPLASNFTLVDRVPQYNLRANYTGTYPLDPLTTLTLSGVFTAAPVNPYTTLQDPTLTPIDAPPAEFSYNMTTTGTETLKRDLSPSTHLTQTTNVVYNFPFNVDPIRASTLTLKNSLAATRSFNVDTITATLSIGYTRYGPGESNVGVTDPRAQLLNTLTATWKRPLTESATVAVDLGVTQTFSLDTPDAQFWSPTGGLHLTYDFEPILVTLNYVHSAVSSIYTATTNLTDNAAIRATLPFGKTGLSLAASAGYIHSIPIGSDATLATGFNSFTSDGGLTCTPQQVPKLSASLRGNFSRQVPVDNPLGATTRIGLMFNLGFSYPNAAAHNAASYVAPPVATTPNLGGDVPLGAEVTAPAVPPPDDAPAVPAAPVDTPPAPVTPP